MTCCSAIACSYLISRRARRSRTRAASSASIGRRITAGGRWSSARGWRCSGPASGAGRRCPTSSLRWSSSASWRSVWAIRDSVRGGSRLGWRERSGVGWSSRPTGSTRRWSGTASTLAPSAWRWWPATARPMSHHASPSPSRTSSLSAPANWSASTVFSSGAYTAPRARSGRSPRSTPTRASLGPTWSSARPPDRPSSTPRGWRDASRASSNRPAGTWNAFSASSDARRSARASPRASRTPGSRSGRPQTNGHVERLHRTILEECWRPAFARYLQVRLTGLRRDLAHYLTDYNFDREHHGRITQGRCPAQLVYGARKMEPR